MTAAPIDLAVVTGLAVFLLWVARHTLATHLGATADRLAHAWLHHRDRTHIRRLAHASPPPRSTP